MKPVLNSNQDVVRLIEEGCRARLISRIVGSPENYPANEFASYFQSATNKKEPACLLASHGKRNDGHANVTYPTYPSLVQTLRWSPYVEMSSANDSKTNIVEDKQQIFKCKCEDCTEKKCPSRASLPNTVKRNVFKDNIMTFSDQYTMTPRLNDVCCGVCIPGLSTPKQSKICVAVKDTESDSCSLKSHPAHCAPIPILKRSESKAAPCPHGHCGPASGHVPTGIRQEAVRDTDVTEEDYCEPIKQKSYKSFFKFKKKTPVVYETAGSDTVRKIIYNEGISDDVANTVPTVSVPPPVNIDREVSKVAVRIECDDGGIPYGHNNESRYHYHCKKSDLRPHFHISDSDNVRHLVDSPRVGRKPLAAKLPVRPYKMQRIALPRKVLTSEMDIDAYVERTRPPPSPPSTCRRKRSKRFF